MCSGSFVHLGAVSECDPKIFSDKEALDSQLLLYPNATLEFCSYGYYTVQNFACETLLAYGTSLDPF
jgi:hypothetical protein